MAREENIVIRFFNKIFEYCSYLYKGYEKRINYIKGVTYDLNKVNVKIINYKIFKNNDSDRHKAYLLTPSGWINRWFLSWVHFNTFLIIRPAADSGQVATYPGHPFTWNGLPFPVSNRPEAMLAQEEKNVFLVEFLSNPQKPTDRVFQDELLEDIQSFFECFFIRSQLRNFISVVKTVFIFTKNFLILLFLSLLLNYFLMRVDMPLYVRMFIDGVPLWLIFLGMRKTVRLCEGLSDAAQIHPHIRYAHNNIVYRYYYNNKINEYLFPEGDGDIIQEIKNIPDNLHKGIIPFLTCLSIATVFLTGLIKSGVAQYGIEGYVLFTRITGGAVIAIHYIITFMAYMILFFMILFPITIILKNVIIKD